jgi:hypothetical protein
LGGRVSIGGVRSKKSGDSGAAPVVQRVETADSREKMRVGEGHGDGGAAASSGPAASDGEAVPGACGGDAQEPYLVREDAG